MINMTDMYQTRSGKKVRVICVDRANALYPVLVLIGSGEGDEFIFTYTAEGRYHIDKLTDDDLIPVPKEYWINVYKTGPVSSWYDSEEQANKWADPDRIACIKFKGGDGYDKD